MQRLVHLLTIQVHQLLGGEAGGVVITKCHQHHTPSHQRSCGQHHSPCDGLLVHKTSKHHVANELDGSQSTQNANGCKAKTCKINSIA